MGDGVLGGDPGRVVCPSRVLSLGRGLADVRHLAPETAHPRQLNWGLRAVEVRGRSGLLKNL